MWRIEASRPRRPGPSGRRSRTGRTGPSRLVRRRSWRRRGIRTRHAARLPGGRQRRCEQRRRSAARRREQVEWVWVMTASSNETGSLDDQHAAHADLGVAGERTEERVPAGGGRRGERGGVRSPGPGASWRRGSAAAGRPARNRSSAASAAATRNASTLTCRRDEHPVVSHRELRGDALVDERDARGARRPWRGTRPSRTSSCRSR